MADKFEWDAPAKLFYWPALEGSDEEAVYANLWDALQAAGEGEVSGAWIITQSGNILTPAHIRTLREKPAPRHVRRSVGKSLFGWMRAA